MAWTAPRSWVHGEVVTAAMMNTHVRDNLLETAPAKATTAGDIFQATGANAIARFGIGGSSTLLGSTGSGLAWLSRGIEVLSTTGEMGSPATVTFNSAVIDQGFRALLIQGLVRSSVAVTGDGMFMRFNNDSSASYYHSYHQLVNSTVVTNGGVAATSFTPGLICGTSAPANAFSPVEILIPGYRHTSQAHKSYRSKTSYHTGTGAVSNLVVVEGEGRWANLAAITQIDLYTTGFFDTGSYLTLYGIY